MDTVIFFMWVKRGSRGRFVSNGRTSGADWLPWVMHSPRACLPGRSAPSGCWPSRGTSGSWSRSAAGASCAFEVAFERHGGALGFCRHMLGRARRRRTPCSTRSRPPTTTFSATRARSRSSRGSTRSPATAACRCCARGASRPQARGAPDRRAPRAGREPRRAARAARRPRELPEEQRAALLLAEAADLSHAEVAGVLGCEVERVKGLVFRARSGLIERRDAHETPCAEIRERSRTCAAARFAAASCATTCALPGLQRYREEVRRQRQMLAVALPVVPRRTQASVLSAAGSAEAPRRRRRGRGRWRRVGRRGEEAAWHSAGGRIGCGAKVALVACSRAEELVAGEAAIERARTDAAAPRRRTRGDARRRAHPARARAPRARLGAGGA